MEQTAEMLKNRINEIRNIRGLSYEELAERADMSPSFASLMARGKRNISLKNLEKLARALECRPEELMGGDDNAPAELINLWASIPAERRDLALQVLQSFASASVDMVKPSVEDKKKNR